MPESGNRDGKREQRKADTRRAIIDAAVRLVHRAGLDQVTVEEIAAVAGVSPATVFNYFPSKASIFFADAPLYRVSEPLRRCADPSATLAHAIEQAIDNPAWTRPIDDEVTRMRFAVVRREPELASRQLALLFSGVADLAAALRRAHPELSPLTATAMCGAAMGALAAVLAQPNGDPAADLRAALAAVTRP